MRFIPRYRILVNHSDGANRRTTGDALVSPFRRGEVQSRCNPLKVAGVGVCNFMTHAEGVSPIVSGPDRTGQRLISFYDQAPVQKSQGVDQLPLSRSTDFDLQGSPPVVRLIYVTLPSNERKLVPFANYDEELARDKLNEALRVVMSLGASRVVAKAFRGSSRHIGGEAGLPKGIGKGRVFVDRAARVDITFQTEGSGGAPVDPRPLRYPDEPGFDAACDAVLKNGTQSLKIEITRQSQFSVESDIAVAFKKVGFRLGASAKKERSNQFVIEAEFAGLRPNVGPAGGDNRRWWG